MANTSIGDTVAYAPLNPPEADGIKRKDDYYRWYFFGTREVLTASGLLPAGLLPPGELPPRLRFPFLVGGREATITRATQRGPGQLRLTVFWTDAEVNADRAKHACTRAVPPLAQTVEVREAQVRAARELAGIPKSHKEFRARAEYAIRSVLGIQRKFLLAPTEYSGFSLNADALVEFDDLCTELVEFVKNAGTVLDVAKQQAKITQLRMDAARADPALQAFITRQIFAAGELSYEARSSAAPGGA